MFFVVVVKGMEEIGREKTEENVFLWCVWIEEKIKKEGKKIFYKSFAWFVKGRKRKNIVVPFNVIEKIKYYTCKLYEEGYISHLQCKSQNYCKHPNLCLPLTRVPSSNHEEYDLPSHIEMIVFVMHDFAKLMLANVM